MFSITLILLFLSPSLYHCIFARGKFGTVYKCTEKSTGLCLAAKLIAVPNRKERKNVERELDMMNRLQHPKIIQLYDAYEYNKMVCVVLEL
jgi:serine/threonine protein kinase